MNIFNKNYYTILKSLFDNPIYPFHIRELARKSGLNPNTVMRITNILDKEKIIMRNKKKNVVAIQLNLENQQTIRIKKLINLFRLYESGLIEFLINKYMPDSVSVLGRYSRGEDIENSDIDMVVISNKKEMADTSKFEKKLSRNMHLIIENEKEFSEEFYNNLINGMILYRYIKNERI